MHVVDIDDKILLIEIISCRSLLAGDKTGTSDPYVKIKTKTDGKDLHKTNFLRKT